MAFGKQIETLRKMRGWTMEDLSSASGVDVGTINAIEKRDSVRSKYAVELAAAFGLTVEDLHFFASLSTLVDTANLHS